MLLGNPDARSIPSWLQRRRRNKSPCCRRCLYDNQNSNNRQCWDSEMRPNPLACRWKSMRNHSSSCGWLNQLRPSLINEWAQYSALKLTQRDSIKSNDLQLRPKPSKIANTGQKQRKRLHDTEIIVATTLIGMLSAIAILNMPTNYVSRDLPKQSNGKHTIRNRSIHRRDWGISTNLGRPFSITAIMTNNGIASGPFPIKYYLRKIFTGDNRPSKCLVRNKAERSDQCVNRNIEHARHEYRS